MKNIDKGIHMTVAAKLRERGVPAKSADAVATQNLTAAKKVFQAAVAKSGSLSEGAVEAGFGAVAEWTKQLRS